MTLVFAALAQLAFVMFPQAPQTMTDEDVLRGLVQQYYDAQTRKDADKAAGFWSTSAMPRMSRDSYLAMFSAGDAEYTPDVQSVTIKGNEAKLRVAVAMARTIVRNDVPTVTRQTLLNAQLWRREGTSWKLAREGHFAEDFADELMAAAPADRARLMAENASELNSSLRYVLSQRGTMAITLGQNYRRGKEIFELAVEVARVANDRLGQAN